MTALVGAGAFATMAQAKGSDRTPPTTPRGVKAVNTATGVRVTWKASFDARGIATYLVYRDGATKPTATLKAKSPRVWLDKTAAATKRHTYVVRARDRSGLLSKASARVRVAPRATKPTTGTGGATTPATPAPTSTPPKPTTRTVVDNVPPTAVGFVGTIVNVASVEVSWNAAFDAIGVANYVVHRNGAVIATLAATSRSYTDTDVSAGTAYEYSVTAVDAAGNVGAPSRATRIVLPVGGTDPDPDPDPQPREPIPWGYVTHLVEQQTTENRTVFADLLQSSGATIARDDARWPWIETSRGVFNWETTDIIVRMYAERGISTLLIANSTPLWASTETTANPLWFSAPPTNPADYANFVAKLVERYGTTGTFWTANPSVPKKPLAGVEIWNEPNGKIFWGNHDPDPVKYTQMLRAAYTAAKAVDPATPVIGAGIGISGGYYTDGNCDGVDDGGVVPAGLDGLVFLEQMYANGAHGYMDGVGWHPYVVNFPLNIDTIFEYRRCSMWSQMEETPVSVRGLMEANGDADLKIWATEVGMPACVPGATFLCANDAQQAQFATREVELWSQFDWAGPFTGYNLRDDGDSTTDGEMHFGFVRQDNTPRPAFHAFKAAWAVANG